MSDALKVRQRVMELLLLLDEKIYYSYRMDNLIVSYLIQAHLKKNNKMTQSLLESVIAYMKAMQHTHYSGGLCFELLELLNRVQRIGQSLYTYNGKRHLVRLELADQA